MSDDQQLHNPYQTPQAGIAVGDVPETAPGSAHPVLAVLAGYGIVYICGAIVSLGMAYSMRTMSSQQLMFTYKLVNPVLHFIIRLFAAYVCVRLARRAEHLPLIVLFCLTIIMPHVISYLWLHTAYFYFDTWSFVLSLIAMSIGGWFAWDWNRKTEERHTASLRSFGSPVE